MPGLAILTLILQAGCAIHVVKTGREYYWIMLIVFVPLLGCLVYIATQILPELRASRGAHRARNRLLKAIDPERELKRLKDELALSDSIDNRLALAEECHQAGRPDDAAELYQACLSGPFADDPHILLKLARVQFDSGESATARQTLDRLKTTNPDFQSSDGHLLYAKALEKLGETEHALEEYAALSTTFPGEEARVRYGLLLASLGRAEEAQVQFDQTLLRARRAPSYYRRKEKRWIDRAKAAGSH